MTGRVVCFYFLLTLCYLALPGVNQLAAAIIPDWTIQPYKGMPAYAQNSTQLPEEDIRDIYGPIELSHKPSYLIPLVTIIAALTLAALTYFFLKRKKSKTIPLNHADIALRKLREAEDQVHNTGPELFAEEVSNILKTYIENSFSIKTTSKTTREFFESLTEPGEQIDDQLRQHLVMLDHCLSIFDKVKFARFTPENKHVDELTNHVRNFIEATQKGYQQSGEAA